MAVAYIRIPSYFHRAATSPPEYAHAYDVTVGEKCRQFVDSTITRRDFRGSVKQLPSRQPDDGWRQGKQAHIGG